MKHHTYHNKPHSPKASPLGRFRGAFLWRGLGRLLLLISFPLSAQQIHLTEKAGLEQVYGTQTESDVLLPMNDLDVEFGYALYETQIQIESENALLEVENIRDYAAVYLDDKPQGTLTDRSKKLGFSVPQGQYTLRLYTENIGRITYGPEILDNLKGLFGEITLDGSAIENWQITELKVRSSEISTLNFTTDKSNNLPGFYRGCFTIDNPADFYLDISGWGMGEAWINGQYIGSYWEEEKQQSIQVPAGILKQGSNELIVFDLKNNDKTTMNISETPVFR